MSSGLIKKARGDADGSGRTGFWPAATGPEETSLPEGTGLLWLEEKMPSWRWYIEHLRDSGQ